MRSSRRWTDFANDLWNNAGVVIVCKYIADRYRMYLPWRVIMKKNAKRMYYVPEAEYYKLQHLTIGKIPVFHKTSRGQVVMNDRISISELQKAITALFA